VSGCFRNVTKQNKTKQMCVCVGLRNSTKQNKTCVCVFVLEVEMARSAGMYVSVCV